MLGSLAIEAGPVVRLPIGLVGAVVAVFVMDRVMDRRSEGWTPPRVAASVLTERRIDEAPERLATVVHYLAGLGTGLLFVWLSLAVETLLGGSSVISVVGTTALLYALMVGFFAFVPLPRARGIGRSRRGAVLRDWAIAAAAYLLVLVPVVTGLSLAL